MVASRFKRALETVVGTALRIARHWGFCIVTYLGRIMVATYRVPPNDKACDDDWWLRQLTFDDYITSDGRVHHSAFKGKVLSVRTRDPYLGKSEFSGRLLSRCGSGSDIRQDGRRRADNRRANNNSSRIRYVGIATARVADIRSWGGEWAADVLFEHTNDDPAHSNIVFIQRSNERFTYDEMKDLQLKLKPFKVDEIEQLHVKVAKRQFGLD